MVRRDYMEVGAAYRDRVEAALPVIDRFKPGATLPAMPGMAINSLIREFKIPKVDEVGYMAIFDPVATIIMVRGHYKNGRATIYAVDIGVEIVPVLVDFEEGVERPVAGTPIATGKQGPLVVERVR